MGKITVTTPTSIILGVHGCTSSMEYFNKDIYDFVEKNMEMYLNMLKDDKKLNHIITRLEKHVQLDIASNVKDVPVILRAKDGKFNVKSVMKHIKWQIKRKEETHTQHAVNFLFDWMWSWGYQNGKLKSHVFPEVPKCMEHWRMHKFIKLFTVSTAPISGQKLFFQSTVAGDIVKVFNNYVQFTEKNKKEASFYSFLTRNIREKPENLLFLTAFVDGAKAATESGIKSIIVVRPGNVPQNTEGFITIESFEDIQLEDDPTKPTTCC